MRKAASPTIGKDATQEGVMCIRMLEKVLHSREQFRTHERWTRPQLEAYQAEQVCRQRAYCILKQLFGAGATAWRASETLTPSP